MKRYLIPLVLLAFAALIISPLGQTMRTVNDTNEMVLLNPRTINSNLFVHVMPPLKGSVWTFIAGDTTGPDTNHLDSVLYPGLGRWVWNNIGTNYFETLIVSNLVAGGDSQWTNKAGVLQPVNLTLPLMITNKLSLSEGMTNQFFRSGNNLNYTNGGAGVLFSIYDGSGNRASHGLGAGGTGLLSSSFGTTFVTDELITHSLRPNADDTYTLGQLNASSGRWLYSNVTTNVVTGFENTSANYSRLNISQPGTNSPVILDQVTGGTAGYSRGFSFRTNGVEVFNVTGTGGPSSAANWTANGTTGSDLRNGVNAMKAYVYNTWANAGVDYERGVLDWITTPNSFTIGTEMGGTGSSRSVQFRQGGTNIFYIDAATGALLWNTDGRNDIGTLASGRPNKVCAYDAFYAGGATGYYGWQYTRSPEFRAQDSAAPYYFTTYVKPKSIQGGPFIVLTNSALSSFLWISVPNTNAIGGKVIWTLTSTDGTDTQQITGETKFGAVAKATTVTATLADVQCPAAIAGGGTLTAVIASNTTTNNVLALGVTPTSSLTTTNILFKWRLETPSTFTVNSL